MMPHPLPSFLPPSLPSIRPSLLVLVNVKSYCESPTSAGICIGSEMSGGVYEVKVWDMVFNNTGYAFRLKSGVGRGGGIANIDFRDSTVMNPASAGVGFEYSQYVFVVRGASLAVPTRVNMILLALHIIDILHATASNTCVH